LKTGDPSRARSDFDEALRIDVTYVLAYLNRGIANEQIGDFVRARADVTAGLAVPARRAIDTNAHAEIRRRLAALGGASPTAGPVASPAPVTPSGTVSGSTGTASTGPAPRPAGARMPMVAPAPLRLASIGDWNDCESLARGRSTAACTRIIEADPTRSRPGILALAHHFRARASTAMGDQVSAGEDLRVAARLAPDMARAYHDRARAYLAASEPARALADLDEALRRTPTLAAAFRDRARVQLELGNVDRALADSETAIRLDIADPTSYVVRGFIWDTRGDRARARADYQAALARTARAGDDATLLEFARRRLAAVSDSLPPIAASKPTDPVAPSASTPAPTAQDIADCRSTDTAKSIAGCSRIIDHGTRQPVAALAEAYHYRGISHSRAGSHDIAIADLSEAIRLRPGYAPSVAARGVAYANRGNADAAFADYSEAIRLNPKDGIAWSNRAGINLRRGAVDAAISDASEALKIRATHIGALVHRAEAWRRKGDFVKARADIAAAIATAPASDYDRSRQSFARTLLANIEADALKGQPAAPPAPTPAPAPAVKAPAYDATKPQRRVALVIGIGAYAAVPHLEHPQTDAREVAAAFRRLGFDDVIERRDVTLAELEADLKAFGDLAAVADWAVLYFNGHALQVDGRNYLMPADAKLARIGHLADETVDLDRVLEKVREARAIKLVILDTCRENPRLVPLSSATGGRTLKKGLAPMTPKSGEVIAACGADGQVIADGDGRHAPFTKELLGLIDEQSMDLGRLLAGASQALARATGAAAAPKLYGVLPTGLIPLGTVAK
jgi:tetratricopeptide (TPR) repeat protein